jgi:hypothetical protein
MTNEWHGDTEAFCAGMQVELRSKKGVTLATAVIASIDKGKVTFTTPVPDVGTAYLAYKVH